MSDLHFHKSRHLRQCRVVTACILGLMLLLPASPAISGQLPEPAGEIILTVTGQIAHTNRDGAADFDMAMLEALEATEINTKTHWTKGASVYRGVRLDRFLSYLGARGKTLNAVALNDYRVVIPVDTMVNADAIIAYRQDGDYMRVRKYGPLWIVVPEEKNQPVNGTYRLNAFLVWQLRKLEVVN
ncbi:molybdopterin-dependent oxidoreductase [Alphaproteobacteria bacterium HT1-32]|nr:molybdopterin-dependent oxidoreductase [Alphaproteobacteria bacterium HT1-32]